MSEDDSLADEIDRLARRARMDKHNGLTLVYLDVAIERVRELEQWRAEVEAACLHYGGDPWKKLDGGKRPAFCPTCGVVIYRWS